MGNKFTADFETTTQENDCRVWAYGLCEIGNPDNFICGNSIEEFMALCGNLNGYTLYFHNLKFDGEFILNWLFRNDFKWVDDKRKLEDYSFSTLISDSGLFYCMNISFRKSKIKILDSLKVLPFSVEKIAKDFNLPIHKLELDYNEIREIGHKLTEKEISYLRNDVEIMARAMKIMLDLGQVKMTTGSNALAEYKSITGKKKFEKIFPPPEYDADVRKCYKGGFTYLNPIFAGRILNDGIVLDVNSLYPSVMYFNKMPYGEPIRFEGKYPGDKLYNLYVQVLKCQFIIKKDHIPSIQIKNNRSYVETEYLTESKGEVVLCLTSVDLDLMFQQYDVYNIEWLGGYAFKSTDTLFRTYIDKWNKIKIQATIDHNGSMRAIAKLMLNSLYGKFATNPIVQSKQPYLENGIVKYRLMPKEERKPIYIPTGAFITSWARYKTITSAQKVYSRFIYADTDSLHLLGTEMPEGLEIDSTKLGAWKHESTFSKAKFIRQKSYIEVIDSEIKITCAGMPKDCYPYVTIDNFEPGMSYPGKLKPTHVPGGIVLKDIDFTIRRCYNVSEGK